MVETKIIILSDTQNNTLLENVKGYKWKWDFHNSLEVVHVFNTQSKHNKTYTNATFKNTIDKAR